MAGTIIADKIQTENAFLTLNVGQTLVATINSSGILNSSGGTMIGANGSVSNTAITGNIISSQIAPSVTLTTPIISGNLNLDSAGTTGIRVPSANTISFHTAGTEDMRIDATGNVGIGIASPTAVTGFSTGRKVLQITPSGGGNTQLRLGTTSGSMIDHDDSGNTITTFRNLYGATSDSAQMQFQSGFMTFGTGTSYTERMRLTNVGRLLIGTTNSILTGGDNAVLAVQADLTGGNFAMGINSSAGGQVAYINFIRQGTQQGYIYSPSGGGTIYLTSSDYRLKENIAPMTGALAKVAQLNPVTYKWKQNGEDGQGFIAHELQEVFPDAVGGEKDAVDTYTDEDGNEQTKIKPQGIDTSVLVATLTAAIQEQQAIITDLKARIEVLEA